MLARHLAADLAQREEGLAEQLRDLEVRAADVEESERDIAARLENLDAREANMDKLDAEAQALRDTVRVHSAPAQPLLTTIQFTHAKHPPTLSPRRTEPAQGSGLDRRAPPGGHADC